MKPNLPLEQQAQLTADFEKLKLSARCSDDIAEWFKAHPEIIPGLSPDLYGDLQAWVTNDESWSNTDVKNKTVHENFTFEFSVETFDEKPQQKTFASITGIKLGDNNNGNDVFHAVYDVTLDAAEWPFITVSLLAELDDEVLESKTKKKILKNLFETHFPHQKWETFLGLRDAGLLPEDEDALYDLLTSKTGAVEVDTPTDFSLR